MRSPTPWPALLLAALSPAVALSAFAQDTSHYYLGLGAGESRVRIDQDRINADLAGKGLTTNAFTRDQRGAAYKLFGGYQMNRHFALEAGVFDLGKFGFNAATTPPGTLTGQIKLQGMNLDLVGTLPLSESFSLIGRVGAASTRARDNFSSTGSVVVLNPSTSKRRTDLKFGGGLQFEFSPAFWVRAEAERYRVDDAVGNRGGVNVVSLSLVFPFGRAATPAPRMAMAPEAPPPAPTAPMPPAPPPEPAPKAMPRPAPAPVVVAPPPRRRVTFAAESLFGFDRSGVRPEGKAALDRFVGELRDTRYEQITVEGHTDRLGTPAYNQRLSQQRAEAVRDYLVSSGGIDASKVRIEAKGESMPLTKPEDCKGETQNARLVACLQPDRRVEIEVVGTR
jgi:OOP family OmpA-OmpF porin